MKRIENECVNCGLPCLGNSCPYKNVVHFYCDRCGEEICQDCLLKEFEVVEGTEDWY